MNDAIPFEAELHRLIADGPETPGERQLASREAPSNDYALWLFDQGIGLFPVVTPGKKPACDSWDDYTCSRAHVARFKNYGVRLGRLGVADTDRADNETWASGHLPVTPFKVRTARGWHHYYRLGGPLPKFIHRDGHTIEFRNVGQYVVGPDSLHESGARYTAGPWSWRWADLPVFPADFLFDDRPHEKETMSSGGLWTTTRFTFPDAVYEPKRHRQLFRLVRSLKAKGHDRATVQELVSMANRYRCHPPLPEDEEYDDWFDRAWLNPDRPQAAGLHVHGVQGLRGL